jgi:hypothetical protein
MYEDQLKKVNNLIKEEGQKGFPVGKISDSYHSFDELYEHRIELYIQLCGWIHAMGDEKVWRTTVHSDGSVWEGWFLLGINKEKGKQITYHLPMTEWARCGNFETLTNAPEYDGHTSQDVLQRLREL